MNNIFNKELLYRVISLLFFLPIVILPIFFSNYVSTIIYLLFLSVILNEANDMKIKSKYNFIFYVFYIISISSFFLFILLLITGYITNYELLTILIIIWLFDTFSFLGGKLIGGMKLMPSISSGKTVSGLIIGILSTLIIAQIFLSTVNVQYKISITHVLIIIALSFAGDTFASLLKRFSYVKDSGNIMPGHGGLLDRFDSFIMVFFIFGITI